MANELKQRLDSVEADLRGLREDRATAVKAREATKEKYAQAIADGDEEAEAKLHGEAMEHQRTIGTIDEEVGVLQPKQVDLLKLLGDSEAASRANGDGKDKEKRGRHEDTPSVFEGWHAAELLADEQIRSQLEFISHSQSRFGSLELGEIATRETLVAEIFAESVGESHRQREGAYRGVMPAVYRPLSFLPLIPTGTTDGNLVPYTQENVATGGAAEVAEGAVKPEAGLSFTDMDAPVRTIAAWMKTRKQVLSDIPALRSTIDSRLRYLVQRRLEDQILNGDGAGVNLLGILNTPGIGSVAANTGVPLTEQILSGITNVYLNEGVADGVVLNPIDWQKALTEKAHFGGGTGAAGTAGSYEYIGGGPFGTTPSTIWGVRTVPSQALAQHTGLVADFALGAQLLIREGLNVLFSDSDQDDFIRNRVTILAEMRAALLVWRPALFQEVAL